MTRLTIRCENCALAREPALHWPGLCVDCAPVALCLHCGFVREASPHKRAWCVICAPPPHHADRLQVEVDHRRKLAKEIADLAGKPTDLSAAAIPLEFGETLSAPAMPLRSEHRPEHRATQQGVRWVHRGRWRLPHLARGINTKSVCGHVRIDEAKPAPPRRRACKWCAKVAGLIRGLGEDVWT